MTNSTRLQVERIIASRMPGWWARVRMASASRAAEMARRSRTSMRRGGVVDAQQHQRALDAGRRGREAGFTMVRRCGLCSWRGEPVDGGELVGGPDEENDQEDEAGEIDGAASAQAGGAADVDHRDVGEPEGEGEQDLGVGEVAGAVIVPAR